MCLELENLLLAIVSIVLFQLENNLFPDHQVLFAKIASRDSIRITRIGYIRIKSCTFQDILQRFDSTNNEIALQSVFCIMKRNFFFFAKCRIQYLWLSTWRVFCLFLIDSHCQDIDLQQDYIYTRYMIIDHDIRDNFFSSKKVGMMQPWQEHLTMCECVQFLLFNIPRRNSIYVNFHFVLCEFLDRYNVCT